MLTNGESRRKPPPSPFFRLIMASSFAQLQQTLGHRFNNPALLWQALTHPSWIPAHDQEAQRRAAHYERLEFLGDAVLTFYLTKVLYELYPQRREGDLTRMRALLIQGKTLADLARQIHLGDVLRLGTGVEETNGRDHDPILENAFEAVLGALLLDGGQERVEAFLASLLPNLKETIAGYLREDNPKGRLQELLQSEPGSPLPTYEVVATHGPPHDRIFTIRLSLGETVLAEASGSSKRRAEEAAAADALILLEEQTHGISPAPLD